MSAILTVFVCGTYRDLAKEREEVLDAIRKLQHQHDSMEYFGARTNRAIETCLDEVRRSDVLVLIVGHLYGSLVPELGISFTEAEYAEGYRLGKPCLVYIRDEEVPILPKYMERDPNKIDLLRKFKQTLKKQHTVATFRNSHDLSVAVAADLSRTVQDLRTEAEANVGRHLDILRQGLDNWNAWRLKNPKTEPDLSGADLSGFDLSSVDFRQSNLTGASLNDANLLWTNFSGANLYKANLNGAMFGETIFGNTCLKDTMGLETCGHAGPSTIDLRTLKKSGYLPESFLRGCQLPDYYIEYLSKILAPPIRYYSCFISHSSKDKEFAERLYADLQSNGVRCWFAPVDMKIGDKIRSQIDSVIRINDKVLLVVSENSIDSKWVENEVETAYENERNRKETVLFPIRLDDAIMVTDEAWAAKLRRSRHIGDFTKWKDLAAYEKAFDRLLRDLKTSDTKDS
jgi:hypothetical protein